MDNKTIKVETFLETFDDAIEVQECIDATEREKILATISSKDELVNGMKLLGERAKSYKEKIEDCDNKIKDWQKSKKMWNDRLKAFEELIEKLMEKLSLGKSFKSDGVKMSTTSRTVLEVDENWIIGQYQVFADSLQTQLPEYVKVTLSIDKTKLFAHLKKDETMLMSSPDKIHTKTTTSTTIKQLTS